jgi:hypothetical protein
MGIFGDAMDRVADDSVSREFSAKGIWHRHEGWQRCGACCYRVGPSGNYWICAKHRVRTFDNCSCFAFEGGEPRFTMEEKKNGCFLTTIACEMSGLSDDCPELTTLRRYRDEILSSSDRGREILAHYDAIAPALATAIRLSPDGRSIALWALEKHIRPAAAAIEQGRFREAETIYGDLVAVLTRQYGQGRRDCIRDSH